MVKKVLGNIGWYFILLNKIYQPCFRLVLYEKANGKELRRNKSSPRQDTVSQFSKEVSQSSEKESSTPNKDLYLHKSFSIFKEVFYYPQEITRSLKKYLHFQATIFEPFHAP